MSTATLERPAARGAESETTGPQVERQLVVLHLGDEIYGVDIACIHTVITPQPITPVPSVPAYVQGVMNLRGRILPVIDLRRRLGLPPGDGATRSARIIIVDAAGLTAGLIVDEVSEVLRLPDSSVEPPSALLGTSDLRCLTGIGRVPGRPGTPDRLILLLDVAQVLSGLEEG